jgi:hypothetical protein
MNIIVDFWLNQADLVHQFVQHFWHFEAFLG